MTFGFAKTAFIIARPAARPVIYKPRRDTKAAQRGKPILTLQLALGWFRIL